MKTRILLALAGLTAGCITPAFSQKAENLVGTWALVSVTMEKDGTKTDLYGPKPQGRLIHDANDHVVVVITRADLPKFAANDRAAGTPEENKAVVQGSLAYLGTSTMDAAAKTLPPILRAAPSRIGMAPIARSPLPSMGKSSILRASLPHQPGQERFTSSGNESTHNENKTTIGPRRACCRVDYSGVQSG
jgi:hypothetical protein